MPVEPVQFATNPVDGQTFQSHGIVLNDGFFGVGAVDERPVDGFGVDVGKVETIFAEVKVDGDDIAQILMHDRVLLGIDRHVAHVILIREDEPRRSGVSSLTSVLIRFPFVVGFVTFAVIRSRCVDAILRADSRRISTFVNVGTCFAISHQPIAWIASAFILDGQVNT